MVSLHEIVREVSPYTDSAVDKVRAESLGMPPHEGGKPCGRVLRALREHAGIGTQAEFADLLGYTPQTIARHEDGQTADPAYLDDPWVRQVLAALLRRAGLGS